MRKGEEFENRAVDYLKRQGYKVLYTNWRWRQYELDIIALKQRCIHFIEVKGSSSKSADLKDLAGRIDKKKITYLKRAIRAFMKYHREYSGYDMSFDVILVRDGEVFHYPNVLLEES